MLASVFGPAFLASLKILLISLAGYIAAKKGILDRAVLSSLSRLLVNLFLPAFIFYHTVSGVSVDELSNWWAFPLIAVGIFVLSGIVGIIAAALLKVKSKREFLSVLLFQNCGYMPLLLISSLFKGEEQAVLYVYVFLFLILFNLLIWSLGVFMLSGGSDVRKTVKKAFNPPFVATVVSVILVFLRAKSFIPEFVFDFARVLGQPVLPLSMLVLGGLLAVNCLTCKVDNRALYGAVFVKLIVLPLIGVFIVRSLNISNLLKWFILVELAVPSAVSLVIITEAYGGDSSFISQALLYTGLLSIITLPLFLTLI